MVGHFGIGLDLSFQIRRLFGFQKQKFRSKEPYPVQPILQDYAAPHPAADIGVEPDVHTILCDAGLDGLPPAEAAIRADCILRVAKCAACAGLGPP